MNTTLWIDDIRNPQDNQWMKLIKQFDRSDSKVVWVKSYDEVVSFIKKNGLPKVVWFDHDLGDIKNPANEKTGYDCAKYIGEYCMDNNCKYPRYNIQSDNGCGRENIHRYIQNLKKHTGL